MLTSERRLICYDDVINVLNDINNTSVWERRTIEYIKYRIDLLDRIIITSMEEKDVE